MEEIINEQLVRDLYSQYNPSADIPQALKLSKNFENNEEFVKAFYNKYAPEKLTFERLQNIKNKYYPTKAVDFGETPEFGEVSEQFLNLTKLSKEEKEDVESKFGTAENPNLDYLVEKERIEQQYIDRSGRPIIGTTKYYQYTEDLNFTKADIETRKREIKNNPANYGIKFNKNLGLLRGNLDYEKQINIALLNGLKQNYLVNKAKYKLDQELSKNNDYYKEYYKQEGYAGYGNVITQSLPITKPDYEKFEKEKKAVQKDIDNYMDLSKRVNTAYENNELLLKEINSFQEKVYNTDHKFNIEGLADNELIQLKDGRLMPADDYLKFIDNVEVFESTNQAIKEKLPYLQTAGAEINDLAVAADLLGKDYNMARKFIARAGTGFGSLAVGTATQLGRVQAYLSLDKGDPKSQAEFDKKMDGLDKLDIKWQNYSTGVMNKYAPDIKFKNAFKDDNFGRFLAQEISTQLPIITSMIATGATAGALGAKLAGQTAASATQIGIASAGEQYGRMTYEDSLTDYKLYSDEEKFLISSGYGAAEGFFGVAPSYYLLGRTFNALGANGRRVAQDGMMRYFGNYIAAPPLIESGSEALTSVVQNGLLGRPVFENVDHAAFSGAMFGALMNTAPSIAGAFMRKFGDIKKFEEFRLNNDKINTIDKQLAKLNKGAPLYKTLQKQRDEYFKANENILTKIAGNINQKVSKFAFNQYMKITSLQETLRSDAQGVIDSDLSNSEKVDALEKLQAEFDLYQNVRDLFRNENDYGNEFHLLKANDPTAYEKFFTQAYSENANFSENDAFKRASELYYIEKYDNAIKAAQTIGGALNFNVQSFDTSKQVLQYVKDNDITIPEKMLDKFTKGSLNGLYFRDKVTGKITQLMSKENSVNNERAGTGYHEIAHGVLYEALGDTNIDYKPLSDLIINWLKVNNSKVYGEMIRSVGPQRADANPEEIVVNFLERVAEGKIKPNNINNKVFMGTVAESLSKVTNLNLDFKSQTDAINLLIGLGEKIKDGTLNKNDLAKIKQGLKPALTEANKKVQSEPTDKVAASDSQAVQAMFDKKGQDAILEIANQKYVKKQIDRIVNKYRDVPKFNTLEEDFRMALISDPVYGILGSLRNYDPTQNPVLVSHILGRLKLKSITIADKIFEEKFTQDVTEAKKVSTDPTNFEILDQRESLRTSLGLTPEIIEKVKKAVIKTFGTKLPNVTSLQFRKALQKAFRTELKPVVTNFIGKGDAYNKFLADNFKLIYSILPQSTLNKRFKDFIVPVLDADGKQLREKTAEGKKIFKKKRITKQEFINYFLGDNVGASTKGTRKTALAEALAEEIAFDATLDVLKQPEVYNKVQTISEMQGHQFNDNYISQVAKEIDRATDFKFSDSGITNLLNDNNGEILESDFPTFYKKLLRNQAKYKVNVKDRKGQALEYYVAKQLEALIPNVKIENIEELQILKLGDTGVDIVLDILGRKYGIEIKDKLSDRIGSVNGLVNINKTYQGELLQNIIEAKDKITERILEKYKQITGKDAVVNSETGAITVDKTVDGIDILTLLGNIKNEKVIVKGTKLIADFYQNKGDQYMYFDDIGLFSLNENPFGLNVLSILDLDLNTLINVNISSTTSTNTKRTLTVRARLNFEKANTNTKIGAPLEIFADDQFKASESIVNLDKEINDMIERKKGIESFKVFSKSKGKQVGLNNFNYLTEKGSIFIPYSAEDFGGFIYEFAGKGKRGDMDKKFFEDHVLRPYNAAMMAINNERMSLMGEFDALKKQISSVPKKLKNIIPGDVFTYSQAIRVYIWDKQGMEVPDLSNNDRRALIREVNKNPDLVEFANTLIKINKAEGYPKPQNSWLAGNIKTDLFESLNKEKRSKHLEQWQQNVDIIFSEKNKNKMRAAYGNNFVANLEGILERMKTGRNRKPGGSPLINEWLDWINGSVGAIMFVNMRSAVLQTISMFNYINWSDNNLIAASKAFANQPQYWSDFVRIFNSDYLRERRGGLKLNVQESELAEAANKRGVRGVINLILKQGFLPTRIADSFAISAGGASFFRNRTNKYIKEGLDQEAAQKKAFEDFMAVTEDSQQSSRPDKISAEQASQLGRVLLAFANTPMQYNRMIKRAGQDLINGRGDQKTNISKIVYYSFVQNLIFNALQKAIFALGFGDDEVEEEKKKKYTQIFDGMVDSLLRGNGILGQIIMASKNVILKYARDEKVELVDGLYDLSPPINSKISKLNSAEYLIKYGKKEEMQKISLRNPGLQAFAQIIEAVFNIPLDRALRKAYNIELWQKVALILGWNEWELGVGPQAEKEKNKKKNQDLNIRGLDNFEKRMLKSIN